MWGCEVCGRQEEDSPHNSAWQPPALVLSSTLGQVSC